MRRTTITCFDYDSNQEFAAWARKRSGSNREKNYRGEFSNLLGAVREVPAGSAEYPNAVLGFTRIRSLDPSFKDPHFSDLQERNWDQVDFNKTTPSNLSGEVTRDSAASIMFHEMLHFTSNNTGWHNHARERSNEDCSKSIFEDRIYMLQAACFPNSYSGLALRAENKKALNCPGVCERAFTEVDRKGVDPSDTAKFSYRFGIIAKPLSKGAAATVCGKLRSEE